MARKSRPIRVGLVNCDNRAYWYGAIFEDIDPEAFCAFDNAKYHHFTFYSSPELRNRKAEGFQLVKVYDENPAAAERFRQAMGARPVVCSNLENVSDAVDLVFICNASGAGTNNLSLARPGLKKGVPTFIDRPFAETTKDGRAMINLARSNRAPLLSCSHVTMLPQAALFKHRFPEIGLVRRGTVIGHGPEPGAVADSLALALTVFGSDVKAVESMGAWPMELLHLKYDDEKTKHGWDVLVTNTAFQADRSALFAFANGVGEIHFDQANDFYFPEGGWAVMEALKGMVRSRKPPVPYGEMLQAVAVAEKARRVHNTGRWANLS
ncbi:MAG: Gfo/Idh/MocA family oxidoreductase [Planctomycetota bacterium]